MALDIIVNGKTTKISVCNALDKVLIDANLPNKETFINKLVSKLKESNVTIHADAAFSSIENAIKIEEDAIWHQEFLDFIIAIGEVKNTEDAIQMINTYGGGHSAAIVTKNEATASAFMNEVDSAAVYHNASTRFTDGGQFGLGGELAISTDKLHQRGPIGLQHLVTNKWYVKGTGQIR